MAEQSSQRAVRRATLACFGLPFLLYAWTAARTVQGGDTGEFGLIGMLGGVPHPPGYPVYALLARLAGHLPVGPPFWRVSLASAACGAAASALLFRIGLQLTGRPGVSLIGAFAFALSADEWRLSGVPEVFSLHACACAAVVLLSLRLTASRREQLTGRAVALGLAFGLGLANHQTLLFAAPIVAWAAVAGAREHGAVAIVRVFLFGLAATLLGLSTYLLLPLYAATASAQSPVWGRVDTKMGFLIHLLRREYGTFQLFSGADARDPARHVKAFLTQLPQQYAWLFFAAGLVGIATSFRRNAGFAIALLSAFALSGLFFPTLFNYRDTPINREITARFHLMPNLLFGVFVAPGLAAIQPKLSRGAGILLVTVALAGGAAAAFRQANWATDTTVERFLIEAVRATKPNAVIVGVSDTVGPGIAWVTRVLQIRPDVQYVDAQLMSYGWYVEEKVRRSLPDVPLRRSGGAVDAGVLARGIAPYRPTYATPWIADEVRQVAFVQPAGILDEVVLQQSPRPALETLEARLDASSRWLAEEPPSPVDAYSEVVRLTVVAKWLTLAAAYRHSGQTENADAAERRARDLQPAILLEGGDDAQAPASGSR